MFAAYLVGNDCRFIYRLVAPPVLRINRVHSWLALRLFDVSPIFWADGSIAGTVMETRWRCVVVLEFPGLDPQH